MSNVYYAFPYAEDTLCSETEQEFIEMYIDDAFGVPLSEKITIARYEPKPIPSKFLNPLEIVLEHLDEEFGGEEEWTLPTPTMQEAEVVFVEAVLSEYQNNAFEEVERYEIDLNEWVKITAYCGNQCDWEVDEGSVAEVSDAANKHLLESNQNKTYHLPTLNYDWLK